MNTMKEVNDQQKEMALKKKIYLLPVPALLLCLYLAACSSLVDTRSFGSDIRIRETDGKDWGENRLKTALAEGESAKIDLGKYTMAELGRGFQVQFYGEDEKPVNPNYDPDTATI